MKLPSTKLEFDRSYGKRLLLFHGYPQHELAYALRPWWRFVGNGLHRPDGVSLFPALSMGDWEVTYNNSEGMPDGFRDFVNIRDRDEALAHVDREWPFPPPPPLVGQVWIREDRNNSAIIVGANFPTAPGRGDWPPFKNAVLVAGPTRYGNDVPWGPDDWTP